ncbi:hypothetical protein GCM10020331_080980 [Ectobacillus funiculus]
MQSQKAWFALMEKLADMTITYVKSQVQAGAKAVQIFFDSWVGALNVADYRVYIKPTMERIFLQSFALRMCRSSCSV